MFVILSNEYMWKPSPQKKIKIIKNKLNDERCGTPYFFKKTYWLRTYVIDTRKPQRLNDPSSCKFMSMVNFWNETRKRCSYISGCVKKILVIYYCFLTICFNRIFKGFAIEQAIVNNMKISTMVETPHLV